MNPMSTLRALIHPEASDQPKHPGRRMTEEQFVKWCTSDTWAEWVDGEVIIMSPVGFAHADLFAYLLHLIRAFVEERDLGRVLTEPFQVRLTGQRRRRSPDILFVSHA